LHKRKLAFSAKKVYHIHQEQDRRLHTFKERIEAGGFCRVPVDFYIRALTAWQSLLGCLASAG
jgi:hypothetical protein